MPKQKLKTETDTPSMGDLVLSVAQIKLEDTGHHPIANFEHGQWWITCGPCGAIWSVVDAEGQGSLDGLDLENIEVGDGSCAGREDYDDG